MTTFHIAQKHLWVFVLLAALIYTFEENHFFSLGVWGFKALMYLWRKVVCLFLFFSCLWDPLNRDALDCVLGLFGKLSRRRGASAWFHDVWTCGAKVLEYWIIFFTEN
jgi:hypothetical protein